MAVLQPDQFQGHLLAGLPGLHDAGVEGERGEIGRYNRQGRKANRRSRDSYSNRAYSRTQTVRNTGTHNLPLYLTRATIRRNRLSTASGTPKKAQDR